MADVIAGEDVSSPNRKHSEVNDLRPADQGEDPSNQPAGKMREDSLRNVLDRHGKSRSPSAFCLLPSLSGYRFTKTTREPQVPIGIDLSGPKPKYAFQSASA